jgi:DNA repair protein RadD
VSGLFVDQVEFVDRIRAAFREGARTVVGQAGTGFGKTHTAAEGIIVPAVARGRRALFIAGLDSLITDTHAKVSRTGLRAGIIQADRPTNPTAPVQVASQQTLHARGDRPSADLVVIDECHHAQSASVRSIIESYPHAWILGLTPVPQRGDGRPLGDVFQRLVCGPSNRWLVENGRLAPCDLLAPVTDGKRAGVADVVAAYERHAPESRAIVFVSTVAQATSDVERFNARGIPAAAFVGETPREERERLRAAVTDGSVKVLVGVGAFVEGFDLPAIETVILARPFGVTGAFLQATGRGRRISPATGKSKCTVIDLYGSVIMHGLPDDERVWSIDGTAVRRVDATTPLRRCSECLAIFRPSVCCPRCGTSSVSAPRVAQHATHAEKLVRWDQIPSHERDRRYLARLERIATTRMRMPPDRATEWALSRFAKQFGRAPGREAA